MQIFTCEICQGQKTIKVGLATSDCPKCFGVGHYNVIPEPIIDDDVSNEEITISKRGRRKKIQDPENEHC